MFAQFAFHACVFSVYSGSSMEIILKISRYPGNLMFAGVCVFNVGTRMSTIKNKMAEGFLETKGF